jgi:hypothetical protein
MKILIAAAVLALAAPVQAAYFSTFFQEPTKPHISAGALFDSRLIARGAASNLSLIFHRANTDDSLIPKSWQEAGIKPIAWSLLDVGIGKQSGDFIIAVGASVNLSPTILGPVADKMKASGSLFLRGFGYLLDSSGGSGIAFGPKWMACPLHGDTFKPFNQWNFTPGWFLGASWQF